MALKKPAVLHKDGWEAGEQVTIRGSQPRVLQEEVRNMLVLGLPEGLTLDDVRDRELLVKHKATIIPLQLKSERELLRGMVLGSTLRYEAGADGTPGDLLPDPREDFEGWLAELDDDTYAYILDECRERSGSVRAEVEVASPVDGEKS